MKSFMRHFIPGLIMTLIFLSLLFVLGCSKTSRVTRGKYTYEMVKGDPLKARIYRLDNGLTVYMTVYRNDARVQTAIPVKVGHKNDPADATGLAHYLEHMFFKGSDEFGSLDYEKERPELDKIIALYEQRFKTTDSVERKKLYHQIDSISGVAAKYAIPNEYDKMLGAIGAKGTNAYTSVEQTVYINNIPSNQLANWLEIEAERFKDPVMRLFHTELEVVYEEKNRSLDNDRDKIEEALYSGLFQKHPYGTQTTLGKIEHLKNPSLQKVIDYRKTYYVPNNMAICLSGDFDPDKIIEMIDNTFGQLPSKDVPVYVPPQEDPIEQPIVKEVVGPEAENVELGFRFGGANSKDADMLELIDLIFNNSYAGLIDLRLNQSQKVLSAGSYPDIMKDYSVHVFHGRPKEGQTLEEVKDLLLVQIESLKKGDFPDWLIPAIINDLKLKQIKRYESNWSRSAAFVNTFIEDLKWEDYVNKMDRLSKITKQDVIDFANKKYGDNYVVVYKRVGEDKNVKKIVKPEITPVKLNRDARSQFATSIMEKKVPEISPVFLDYEKDIEEFSIKDDIPVFYKANVENGLFQLYYILDMGTNNDKRLGVALDYLTYLGTSKYTPEQLKEEFYKVGCSFSVSSSEDKIWVSLSGLAENFEKGLPLLEELLADAQPNKEALDNLVKDILKKREDNKKSRRSVLRGAMVNYGMYGPKSPYTNILSEEELKALTPSELIDIIKSINGFEHRILYYGPADKGGLTASLNKYHNVPDTFNPIPAASVFTQLPTKKNQVYVVDYDMKQAEIMMLSKDEPYNKNNVAIRRLFNEYYGGSMCSIVFQTLREAKALAYSTWASYSTPDRKDEAHYIRSYIGTQADKLPEAMAGMTGLLDNMPESDVLLEASKDAIIKQIQSERITKSNILFDYEHAEEMGNDHDLRRDVYDNVRGLTMADVKAFHDKYFKNKKYTILVLGDRDKLDKKVLAKYGDVKYLTLDEVFGY